VTLLRCQGGPQVIDSLNYATLGLGQTFGQLLAPFVAELGNGSETVMVAYQRTSYYAAPGASAWRTAYILLFPQSHRIALLQREDVET
jgi:hypothetical protein